MKVATGLSRVSGMFRCKPWMYIGGVRTDEYPVVTLEETVKAALKYDPIKARRELIEERERRYNN